MTEIKPAKRLRIGFIHPDLGIGKPLQKEDGRLEAYIR
jgi:hypothetical protein